MFAIDTNVASELMRPEPTLAVAAWIAERDAQEMYLTAVSEAELRYGVAIMPVGKRRNALEAAMTHWLDRGFRERILPFDSAAARAYAEIAADRRQSGRAYRRGGLPDRGNMPLTWRSPGHPERAGFQQHWGRCCRSLGSYGKLTGFGGHPSPSAQEDQTDAR